MDSQKPNFNQPDSGTPGWFESTLSSARSAGLTFSNPRKPVSKTAQVNGLSLRYLDWGNPDLPDLLFIHGFAQQAHSWDFAALALQNMFHVVAIDLRGHGESEWSQTGAYRFEDFESDIERFISTAGLNDPVICGLSLGGALASAYASLPKAKISALIAAEAAPENKAQGRENIQRFTAAASETESFASLVARAREYTPWRTEEQIRGSLMHSVRSNGDGTWSWKYDPAIGKLLGMRRNPDKRWEALGKIKVPTLFVRGADSDMTDEHIFERMRTAVPGSESVTVPDAGHRVAGDNPMAFNDAVIQFLSHKTDLVRPSAKGE